MTTVLIVEDHAISRQMLGNLLGYKGYRVLEANDGVDALAIARAEHPDLIITDIVMPAMDGFELVRRLRTDPALSGTPVIFYSAANLRSGVRQVEEQSGNSRLLEKPSEPSVILEAVEEMLGATPAPAPGMSRLATAAVSVVRPPQMGPLSGSELRLAVLIDLGFHLVKQREPRGLLNTFCSAIRELLKCRRSLLVVNGDDQGQMRQFSGTEDCGPTDWPDEFSPPRAILDRVMKDQAAVRWPAPHAADDGGSSPQVSAESVLVAPFATPSRVYGYLLLADKQDGARFDDPDQEIAVTLGAQTALAYENILILGKLSRQSAELKASEERLRLLIEGAKDYVIVMLDPEGRFASWNVGAERTTGWSADEILGRHLSSLYPPEHEAEARRGLELAAVTGAHRDVGERVRKDGSRFWADVTVTALRDAGGQLRGFAKVARDITERKEAEEQRERTRQGLSRLAEASLRVVRETHLEGMLQAVSDAALFLTNARIATCGHRDVSGQMRLGGTARAPGAPACPPGNMFEMVKGGVHIDLEGGHDTIRLSDAELRAHPRWWGLPEGHVPMRGLLGAKLTGRDGQTIGILLVTDKTQGEFTSEDESLLRQLATLASLALQHVELRIVLEQSDRRKDQFLGMLSHELRNPLTPIHNSLFVLDRVDPGSEQARRAKAVIDRQIVHLTRLVDDLLDVTRIAHGKVQLRKEVLDVCEVVRRTVEDHRGSFQNKQVKLRCQLAECPLWTHGDRTRIAQVVSNLLSNSAKFTDPGGVCTVLVESHRDLGQVVIRVKDTGVGIAPEMLPRVFEAFSQADTTLDRSKGGLGLGLALVKGLVEMHGGTASAASDGLGKGTEIVIRLMLEPTGIPTPGPNRAAETTSGAKRVLIIEDNIDAAESLREALQLHRRVVEVAYSGISGIEKARTFRPDVVLCDIGLPGMDGYAVARTMKADPDLARITLVALTGYALSEDVAKARDAGFVAHLAKPPGLDTIEKLLAGISSLAP